MQVRLLHKKQRSTAEHLTIFVLVWRSPFPVQVVFSWNFLYTATGCRAIRLATPIDEYQQWRRRNPAIGCRFASIIAIAPPRYGQIFEIVPTAATPARIAENIANRVTELLENKRVSAAGLLFPCLTTLEDTARVMLALKEQPKWGVTPTVIQNDVAGDMVAVRIVREIPFGKKACDSESLVLGDFAEFPPTRRSPITAMELFVGEPLKNDPKSGKPTTQANLAHIIDRDAYGHKPYDTVWENTREGRRASLGLSDARRDDNRAKARVTFVMPFPLARRLECLP